MKVRELIAQLQKLDQDADVQVSQYDEANNATPVRSISVIHSQVYLRDWTYQDRSGMTNHTIHSTGLHPNQAPLD